MNTTSPSAIDATSVRAIDIAHRDLARRERVVVASVALTTLALSARGTLRGRQFAPRTWCREGPREAVAAAELPRVGVAACAGPAARRGHLTSGNSVLFNTHEQIRIGPDPIPSSGDGGKTLHALSTRRRILELGYASPAGHEHTDRDRTASRGRDAPWRSAPRTLASGTAPFWPRVGHDQGRRQEHGKRHDHSREALHGSVVSPPRPGLVKSADRVDCAEQ